MIRQLSILALVAIFQCLGLPSARAEVAASAPSSFVLQAEGSTTATPDAAWAALGRIGAWWSSAHTYSGDSARLSLQRRAGGCFCERWEGQSVEHARVVLVMEQNGVRTLRLQGALGPLQEMGVSGVLTFTVAPHPGGAMLTMTYRVAGDPGLGLAELAPLVDQVLMEQFARLRSYATSGAPQ